MTDGLRIAHLRIAPQWAILRWAILTFTKELNFLDWFFKVLVCTQNCSIVYVVWYCTTSNPVVNALMCSLMGVLSSLPLARCTIYTFLCKQNTWKHKLYTEWCTLLKTSHHTLSTKCAHSITVNVHTINYIHCSIYIVYNIDYTLYRTHWTLKVHTTIHLSVNVHSGNTLYTSIQHTLKVHTIYYTLNSKCEHYTLYSIQ